MVANFVFNHDTKRFFVIIVDITRNTTALAARHRRDGWDDRGVELLLLLPKPVIWHEMNKNFNIGPSNQQGPNRSIVG